MFPRETTEGRPISLQDIAALVKLLGQFLSLFADCFRRPAGRLLLAVYVRGLLSNVQRKNVESLALAQRVVPRTLQRFLESIRWDEERLRDRCQQQVAAEHADPEALAGGRTLSEVRDAAGHANVSITSGYLHIAVDDDQVGALFDFEARQTLD